MPRVLLTAGCVLAISSVNLAEPAMAQEERIPDVLFNLLDRVTPESGFAIENSSEGEIRPALTPPSLDCTSAICTDDQWDDWSEWISRVYALSAKYPPVLQPFPACDTTNDCLPADLVKAHNEAVNYIQLLTSRFPEIAGPLNCSAANCTEETLADHMAWQQAVQMSLAADLVAQQADCSSGKCDQSPVTSVQSMTELPDEMFNTECQIDACIDAEDWFGLTTGANP